MENGKILTVSCSVLFILNQISP